MLIKTTALKESGNLVYVCCKTYVIKVEIAFVATHVGRLLLIGDEWLLLVSLSWKTRS